MPACYKCAKELADPSDYGRQDRCPSCGFATRCCLNCQHYEPTRYNECTEPVADRVVEKEKGNFCDYFKPGSSGKNNQDTRSAALKAAEALFKKK